jgi:hypothetical protein
VGRESSKTQKNPLEKGQGIIKDRKFNKTQNLIFESPAPQGFQKLKTRF